jgi:hypothetical protein
MRAWTRRADEGTIFFGMIVEITAFATSTPVTGRASWILCVRSFGPVNDGNRADVLEKIAVVKPVPINIQVATTERIRNCAMPQIACPLVQPFPSVVPTPTHNPASINRLMGKFDTSSKLPSTYLLDSQPPNSKPPTRQNWLVRYGLKELLKAEAPFSVPEAPVTLPNNNMRVETTRPIITPPIAQVMAAFLS